MTYNMEWKTNQREEKEQPLIEIHEEFESTAGGKCEGGVTFALFFSIFIAVSGSFTCGFAGGYSSPVHFAIIKDLHLSTAEYSLFGSLLTAGGLLGATVCGKLTDLTGRRGAMGLSSILCLAGWLSIAYSQDSMSLYIGRLALGFANGIMTYTFLMCCGIAAAFLVGLIISWRSLALMGTIPCMIQFLGIFFIPESPRWLVTASSVDDFEAALKRIRGQHTDISEEAADIKVICNLGLMALGGFGGTQGILFYASAIFESAGVPGSIGTIAMGLIQLPPFALCVFFMDKYGRRPLLLFSAGGMGIACFLVALSFLFKAHGLMMDTGPYLALVGILIFSASFPIGMGGIPCVIMSEVFPINIKGAAGTLATVVSSTSSWIVTYTFIFMMQWSSSGTFLVFASVNAISVIFVAKLVPETKGRTLEEIQELIIYKGPVMDAACNTRPLL
uniref:Major facilitator superfamily (MFS) profile domain-containing protein n=1 Tax=Chenopodium quinoa TaxID=63459 RepID=A0A803KPA0_CHEQI